MSPVNEARGATYWRSLEHLADTPEFRTFMHREFPAGASELMGEDRRHFIKLMGASMALAGLGMAGCRRWPTEEIAPYASRPAGQDPGVPLQYATVYERSGVAMGLLATSYDGRPTKVEGNPDHPGSLGATDGYAQASILDLYDPDRSTSVMRAGEAADHAALTTWLAGRLSAEKASRGYGLAILSERTDSPTVHALRARLEAIYPQLLWCEYDPLDLGHATGGAAMAFGRPWRTHLRVDQASVIVSLDSDFLQTGPAAITNARGFAAGRRVTHDDPRMSRFYAVESDVTVTGANADHRLAVKSRDVGAVTGYLAARILGADDLRRFENGPAAAEALSAEHRRILDAAVKDLRDANGAGLIIAGDRQPAEVHALVHAMNDALGHVGRTVAYAAPPNPPTKTISDLAAAFDQDRVKTLVILGGNPVYDAPADVKFAERLAAIDGSVHLSPYHDETSSACTWHVPRAHYLESWGDGRAWDGTYAVGQPLIRPLYEACRTPIQMLAMLAGEADDGQALVRRTVAEMTGRTDGGLWRTLLHDGQLAGSASTIERPRLDAAAVGRAGAALFESWSSMAADAWEIVFAEHPTAYDGRYANNGWLQETPDPISKLTWDNAVLLGVATAKSVGVKTGDVVNVSTGTASVDGVPVAVLPGLPNRCAIVHVGYGRSFAGRICTGAGFDVYPLRTSESMGFTTGTVTKASGRYPLATTQDHHTIDPETVGGKGIQDRLPTLFREADLAHFESHPDFAHHTAAHVVHRLSLWEENNLDGSTYAWGMSIDLNACTGCGTCIVACQAENNIPVVGKDQVLRGREMHWLRVDRYFTFQNDEAGHPNPERLGGTRLMPVMCLHCENAPCEQVCPVAATVHDEDGLNVMVYNRCIGTRYCSNNCPYKVRRFNYFDYHRRDPLREQGGPLQVQPGYYTRHQATPASETLEMQFNPEVSVRMRGVMEKCTYCTQRIADAKIKAKNAWVQQPEEVKAARANERVPVADGAITPACAQACPTQAIVFGDLADSDSRVSDLHARERSYQMLEEINPKTRTTYLAKVTNPAFPPVRAPGHGKDASGESSHDNNKDHG